MQIEGKKNLELIKRSLLSHLVNCSVEALRSDDKKSKDYWDPEIAETNLMLDAVEKNLEQFKEGSAELALENSSFGNITPFPLKLDSPQGGRKTDFFR
jgi:hypothetical protein